MTMPKLPEADEAIRKKVRTHILFIAVGGLFAVWISYVPLDTLLGHWLPVVPTLPNVAFEALDRIYNR